MAKRTKLNWSWTSALVGAASALATSAVISSKPKDPIFDFVSIQLTSFNPNFPFLNVQLILTVHVTNPNIGPIHYSTTISIFYKGALLGSAKLQASSQPAKSSELIRLSARVEGLQMASHAVAFIADVAKREMVLDAVVDIVGAARVWWWDHKFKVHVDTHVTVDPVFLNVIDPVFLELRCYNLGM